MRLFAVLMLVALAGAAWWFWPQPHAANIPAPAAPAPSEPAAQPSIAPKPSAAIRMELSSDSVAKAVIKEVERATRPRQCQLAQANRGSARLACLLVESDDYIYQLDVDLAPESFPCLKQFDFKEPADPQERTMSMYRSLAKTSMQYQVNAGDRLIILLCPKTVWAQLNFECTNFNPVQKPLENEKQAF